jgi:hypothetical protein
MKSGKQRRSELKTKKQSRLTKVIDRENIALEIDRQAMLASKVANGEPIVDINAIKPNNSYDVPDFVKLGYYLDRPFNCAGCNNPEIWKAAQQKWWYEEAKGDLWSIAKFCRTCRRQEQTRRSEARRIHLEGIAKKERDRFRKAEAKPTN